MLLQGAAARPLLLPPAQAAAVLTGPQLAEMLTRQAVGSVYCGQ